MENDEDFYIIYNGIWLLSNIGMPKKSYTANTVYDGNGNLILVEFKNIGTNYIHAYRITYNKDNKPVLVESDSDNFLFSKIQYEYNENGQMTLVKRYFYDSEKDLMEISHIETAKFDEKERPVRTRHWIATPQADHNDVLHKHFEFVLG